MWYTKFCLFTNILVAPDGSGIGNFLKILSELSLMLSSLLFSQHTKGNFDANDSISSNDAEKNLWIKFWYIFNKLSSFLSLFTCLIIEGNHEVERTLLHQEKKTMQKNHWSCFTKKLNYELQITSWTLKCFTKKLNYELQITSWILKPWVTKKLLDKLWNWELQKHLSNLSLGNACY